MLALTLFFIILWVAPMIGFRLSGDEYKLFWIKSLHFWPTFIPTFFLIFSYTFPSMKNITTKAIWIAVLVPNLFFATVIAFSSLAVDSYLGNFKYNFGPLAIPLVSYYIIYFLIATSFLTRTHKKSSPLIKAQIKFLVIGINITAGFALTTNLIFPIFGYFDLNWLGQIIVLIFVGFIFYSIVRYRLMDIRFFVFKSFTFLLSLTAMAVLYLVIAYFAYIFDDSLESVANLFTVLVIALVYGWTRKSIEHFFSKIFGRGFYELEDLLHGLSAIINANFTTKELSQKLIKALLSEMHIKKALFATYDFSCQSGFDFNKKQKDSLFKLFGERVVLVADELEEGVTEKGILRNYSIEVLIFFGDNNENLKGYLALSKKVDGAFNARDLKLLEIIAPQISIALKNIEQQQQMIEQIVEERRRIDQDAHDHIYNRLGALAQKAELAELNPKEAQNTLALLKTDLRSTVGDLQKIVKGENEAQVQDDIYIIDKLKKITTDFEKQSSIKLNFECACKSLQLIEPKNLWHFQCILEECLNNIRKHSKATKVDVNITANNGSIVLQVKDNGIGISVKNQMSNLKSKNGMGLSGMQDRAKKIGGLLTFSPNNGSGTKVELEIPVG